MSKLKQRVAQAVMHAWLRRGWFAYLAWPLAQLFSLAIRLRSIWYQCGWLSQKKLPVPVIVVGNIFVGGTGKTPLTLWLLERLKKAGYRPGVISRGYGRKSDQPCVVVAQSQVTQVGDEPLLIAQQSNCPVVVGRNRFAAGQKLLQAFPTTNMIISDDGLQHLALARDVEINVCDARGAGNGWLLPAGPLREPITRRCDFTVANLAANEKISVALPPDTIRMQLKGARIQQLCDVTQSQDLSALSAELNIVAAAGIGHPERFFTMLHQQGVRCTTLPLPDHFDFADNPFKQLSADLILITEKDAVKCRQLTDIANDPRIWVVVAQVAIDEDFMEKILNKVREKRGSSST